MQQQNLSNANSLLKYFDYSKAKYIIEGNDLKVVLPSKGWNDAKLEYLFKSSKQNKSAIETIFKNNEKQPHKIPDEIQRKTGILKDGVESQMKIELGGSTLQGKNIKKYVQRSII